LFFQRRQAEITPYENLLHGLFGQIAPPKLPRKVPQKGPFITPDEMSKIVRMAVKATLNVESVIFRHFQTPHTNISK
jgi:hypothetical protein